MKTGDGNPGKLEERFGWIKYEHVGISHEDHRRALTDLFNGDFVAKQGKKVEVKIDCIMGNHYHPYRQFFFMDKGEADYAFVNVDKPEERVDMHLIAGDKVIIDKRIAHRAIMKAGNVTIEGNEESYTSPEVDDLKYKID